SSLGVMPPSGMRDASSSHESSIHLLRPYGDSEESQQAHQNLQASPGSSYDCKEMLELPIPA
ncbi:MAG TPA: hypothetical protein VKJ45_04630, partial [Blastocatellia bacterium]|nr:hypothetical protein [Blastocatellia bacterium]